MSAGASVQQDNSSMFFSHILLEFVDIHIKLSMITSPSSADRLVNAGN
jgi:hypothetical protein